MTRKQSMNHPGCSAGVMAAPPPALQNGIRQSRLSPKYLDSNSTSHNWPFSAVAELIDNAYDPDVSARELRIELKPFTVSGTYCFTFTDDGAGMNADSLHKMLSFGFCDKDIYLKDAAHKPVGHYGNGFKSGSMRLGRDAIVFTMQEETMSVGLLSQSYLAAIQAETILVPITSWKRSDKSIMGLAGSEASLEAITKYSLFHSEAELFDQFQKHLSRTGTHIVIYNLRQTLSGHLEFDLETDPNDIMIPDDVHNTLKKGRYKQHDREDWHPAMDYSLKAYCSILYLKPKMKIYLRGKKVQTQAIAKSLTHTEVDVYRPRQIDFRKVKIVYGFSPKKHHYGVMMYHHNRLIKGYVRVGNQVKNNGKGVGVVGVIECNFLHPTHNKQDFEYDIAYRACLVALGNKLNEYWFEKKKLVSVQSSQNTSSEADDLNSTVEINGPDQTWVQCDHPTCLKWRKLPLGTNPDSLPDKWFCHMNPDPLFQSCSVPEEEEDEDAELQGYDKKEKKKMQREKHLVSLEDSNMVVKHEDAATSARLHQIHTEESTIKPREEVIRHIVDARRAQQLAQPGSQVLRPLLPKPRDGLVTLVETRTSVTDTLPRHSNTSHTSSASKQTERLLYNYAQFMNPSAGVRTSQDASPISTPSSANSRKRALSSSSNQEHPSQVSCSEFLQNTTVPETDTSMAIIEDSDSDVVIVDDSPAVPSRRIQCDCSKGKKHPFTLPEALAKYSSHNDQQRVVELYKQAPHEIFDSLVQQTAELDRLRGNVTKLLRTVAADLFTTDVNLPADELLQTVVNSIES